MDHYHTLVVSYVLPNTSVLGIKARRFSQVTCQIQDNSYNMPTDIAIKKELITTFASIPDTADGSVLDSLSNMRVTAETVADKLTDRIKKRDEIELLDTVYYPFDPSPAHMVDIENAKKRKMIEDEAEVFMDHLVKTWTPEQQEERVQGKIQDAANAVSYQAQCKAEDNKRKAKEADLAAWFADFCNTIDAKIAKITANIPGYCAAIVIAPPAKKSKPSTPVEVRIAMACAFKKPESDDNAVLLSSLNSQLQTSQATEARVRKTFDTRQVKIQAQKVAKKAAKTEGMQSMSSRKALAVHKSPGDWDAKVKDHADLEIANWFKQHALAVKAKIALVEAAMSVID